MSSKGCIDKNPKLWNQSDCFQLDANFATPPL